MHRCVSVVPTALHVAQEVPQPAGDDSDDDDVDDDDDDDDDCDGDDACHNKYACNQACAHLVVRLGLM